MNQPVGIGTEQELFVWVIAESPDGVGAFFRVSFYEVV